MQKLDGEIKEVNGWIDGAEKKMDEIESQGPNDAVLKVVMSVCAYVVLILCVYWCFTSSHSLQIRCQ